MAKPNKKAHKAERVADQSRDMREELIATLHSVVPEAFEGVVPGLCCSGIGLSGVSGGVGAAFFLTAEIADGYDQS